MVHLYDHAPDDVPRLATLPAWNEVNVHNGLAWLNDAPLREQTLCSFRQTLDMYDGSLHTRYEWTDERVTSIVIDTFISRADPHLAVVRLEVTPRSSGLMKIALPLRCWPAPVRVPLARIATWKEVHEIDRTTPTSYPGHMVFEDSDVELGAGGALLRMVSRADGGSTAVSEAAALSWPAGLEKLEVRGLLADGLASVELTFDAAAGRSCTFTKFVGVVPSFAAANHTDRAAAIAEAARARGYDAVYAEHAGAWHRIWETDIVVEGDPALQTALHANLFYLLESVREGTEFNIPPMGLSNRAFNGHVFCDAEFLMFPTLLALHPEMARSLVMFRARGLEAAMVNARINGYAGAKYPWEADERGQESTLKASLAGAIQELAVNGHVAVAQWQYYVATGDRDYLARCGLPVIRGIAEFWLSRMRYNRESDRYEIGKVQGNEGLPLMDDDTFVNGIARRTFEAAIAASRVVGAEPDPRWQAAAQKIFIPYDPAGDLYPPFAGADPFKANVGFVGAALSYPLELPMSDQARRNTFDYTLASAAITDLDNMGFIYQHLYPVVAAELGEIGRIDEWLPATYARHLRPPFHMFIEHYTGGLESVAFLTAAGGFEHQFLYGYTGLRWTEDGLAEKFSPILPSHLTKLTIRNMSIRGRRFDLVVQDGTLRRIAR
jgi:trehalose/maltose hydrolase-like predicted phosphorylase